MISVIVIAKNEQDRIDVCLKSVKWADEIIVADNGSTDGTIDIALRPWGDSLVMAAGMGPKRSKISGKIVNFCFLPIYRSPKIRSNKTIINIF